MIERQNEIETTIERHTGALAFLTLTIQHHKGEKLNDLLEALTSAHRRVKQTRRYKQIKSDFGLIGEIKALEITYSDQNGWHPHFHVLLLFENDTFNADALKDALYPLWNQKLNDEKKYAGYKYGCHVEKCYDKSHALAAYATKLGLEMTLTEYAQATKGKSRLRFSQGLKKRFNLEEKSDEEIANTEEDGQEIASIASDLYRAEIFPNIEKKIEVLRLARLREWQKIADLLRCPLQWRETRSGVMPFYARYKAFYPLE
jgi:hypothetical protein